MYIVTLTLWLWLADNLAKKTCILGTDGQQIGPLDLTIVAQMTDKFAELTVHAKHECPINWPRDYQPGKDENLCQFSARKT